MTENLHAPQPVADAAPFPLWLVGPDAPLDGDAMAVLHPSEIARVSRFRDKRLRMRGLRVRAALRRLIEHLHDVPAREQRFEPDGWGKPRLVEMPDVQFSVSYSGDHGLIGIAKGMEIGVDLERIRTVPDAAELEQVCFTSAERAAAGRDFLTGWTRKEACLKALGCGLAMPLQRIRCGMVDGEATVRAAGAALRIRSGRLHADYVAAWAWRC